MKDNIKICPICKKEFIGNGIRHHKDPFMKMKWSERYKQFLKEDLIYLCSQRCHIKQHNKQGVSWHMLNAMKRSLIKSGKWQEKRKIK